MMIAFSFTPELEDLARNTVWFEPPDAALAKPLQFIAYVLTLGTYGDVKVLRRYLSDDDLRLALENAPPGIFDPRSWAYWNPKLGRYPMPPLPKRRFGDFPH